MPIFDISQIELDKDRLNSFARSSAVSQFDAQHFVNKTVNFNNNNGNKNNNNNNNNNNKNIQNKSLNAFNQIKAAFLYIQTDFQCTTSFLKLNLQPHINWSCK